MYGCEVGSLRSTSAVFRPVGHPLRPQEGSFPSGSTSTPSPSLPVCPQALVSLPGAKSPHPGRTASADTNIDSVAEETQVAAVFGTALKTRGKLLRSMEDGLWEKWEHRMAGARGHARLGPLG